MIPPLLLRHKVFCLYFMEMLSIEEQRLLQAELDLGESVIWTGRPDASVIFHTSDWFVIPFSLMWGGFAIFWEVSVTRQGWNLGTFWGIPFVLIGQYIIWGRFIYSAWKKRRIVYLLTNQRVIVLVLPPGQRVISRYLSSIPGIDKNIRSNGIGTLKFGDTSTPWNRKQQADSLYLNTSIPVFVDIENASEVATLVNKQIRASLAQ